MEDRGKLSSAIEPCLEPLSRSLIATAELLLGQVDPVALDPLNDLQILTLGPQLRGSHNVDIGQEATKGVSALLRRLLAPYSPKTKGNRLSFKNDSQLVVEVQFGSDPDISITQRLGATVRKLVAVEIKGGVDASNVWNRLGEAEKSHQSAKKRGYNELWTLTAVDLDASAERRTKAAEKSPTTTKFFFIPRVLDAATDDGTLFRQLLGSIMGVRFEPQRR